MKIKKLKMKDEKGGKRNGKRMIDKKRIFNILRYNSYDSQSVCHIWDVAIN